MKRKQPSQKKFQKFYVVCGEQFLGIGRQLACSGNCSNNYRKSSYQGKVCAATCGAIGELRVCVDLLSKGYEVYRGQSPACSSDLIAWKENCSKRIEVRTGCYLLSGGIICDIYRFKADILAVVLRDKIVYIQGASVLAMGSTTLTPNFKTENIS